MLLVASLFAIAVATIGTLILLGGWRGRAIDEHPLCRLCGFDLIGLPAGAQVCSECGADLTRPRALQIGNRERSTKRIAWGGGVLIVSLASLALLAMVTYRSVDPRRYLPVWFLVSNADSADLAELNRRLAIGQLSSGNIKQVVEAGLAVQAHRRLNFQRGWGTFIEWAHANGNVTPQQWNQYARNSIRLNCTAMPMQPGDRHVKIIVLYPPGRVGDARIWRIALHAPVAVGGDQLIESLNIDGYSGADVGSGDAIRQVFMLRPGVHLSPGDVKSLRVEVHVEVFERGRRRQLLTEWTESFDVPIEFAALPATTRVTAAAGARTSTAHD